MAEQTVRPLVPTTIRTEFGEVLESEVFHRDTIGRDLSYVPGYSELRRARDMAKGLAVAERATLSADPDEAAAARHQAANLREGIRRNMEFAGLQVPVGRPVQPSDVPSLPVRLQWVRTNKYSGAPENFKKAKYGKDGYRIVTNDDVGASWLRNLPEGSVANAAGEIHDQGDCILMVADAKTAARRAAEDRAAVDRMTRDAAASSELMKLGNTVRGTDPTFEVLPGRTISAPPSAIKG